jgi:catechol 2,3-dioxygenase-like lactoylglutathione lyase family enzyme
MLRLSAESIAKSTSFQEENMIDRSNVTVMVRDFEKAIRFYTETMGFKLILRAANEWAEVAAPGLIIGIHPWSPGHGPEPGKPSGMSMGFEVAEIGKAVEAFRAKGINFHGPVQDNDNVKLAFFGDPDGNALYLCEVKQVPAHAGKEASEARP